MSLYMNGIAHTAGQMKKIKKQTSVTPVRSVTPILRVRYVLLYERHSSYRRMAGKKLKQSPVRSVTPVSQIRYVFWMVHIAGHLKNEKQPSANPACPASPASP